MSENEFNANQQRAYRKKPERSPEGLTDKEWKTRVQFTQNRFHVGAKLSKPNWMAFRAWMIKEDLSLNSGINRLIATHPDISPDVAIIINNLKTNPHHYD